MIDLNIAIIGYGPWGKLHSEKITNQHTASLFAIVERSRQKHNVIRKKYPDIQVFSEVSDLPLDKIDGVIIATPTSTHYELVRFFLDNKIHVFCEKPLCSNLEEAKNLGNFLKPGIILQVGHSERFHPVWETLREDLTQTDGPYQININRITPYNGRATDTGVVQDLMIHDLDLIRFLFSHLTLTGLESHGVRQRTLHFDHVQARLSFEEGSIATITASRNNVRRERSLGVICEQGSFWVDLINLQYLKALRDENNRHEQVSETGIEISDTLALQQKAFFEAIKNKGRVSVDYREGLAAIELVQKIYEQIVDMD